MKDLDRKYVWYNASKNELEVFTKLNHLYLKIYCTFMQHLVYLGVL